MHGVYVGWLAGGVMSNNKSSCESEAALKTKEIFVTCFTHHEFTYQEENEWQKWTRAEKHFLWQHQNHKNHS